MSGALDISANDVVELLESGNYKAYLRTMAVFHNYSWRNILLIFKQKPNATKIATYEQWKHWGRQVKRGSISVKILAPDTNQSPKKILKEKPLPDVDNKKAFEEVWLPTVSYKKISVFDISQTHGNPVPQIVDNILNDSAHTSAFIDVLTFMTKYQVQDDISHFQAISKLVNNIAHEYIENVVMDEKHSFLQEIEIASISYVVGFRFGIDASFNILEQASEWTIQDIEDFISVLSSIRNKANLIISTVEDKFTAICDERNINPLMSIDEECAAPVYPTEKKTPDKISLNIEPEHVPQANAAPIENEMIEVPSEPRFNVETYIESAAGINFTQYKIVPITGSEQEGATSLPLYQPQMPSIPQIPKSEVPIYMQSLEVATSNGQEEDYFHSYMLNIECAVYIDYEIKNSKDGNVYDLVSVVRRAREVYGLQRVRVVVAAAIQNYIRHYSASNTEWAKKIVVPLDSQEYGLSSHKNIIDVLAFRLREVETEKASFKSRLEKASMTSKALFG